MTKELILNLLKEKINGIKRMRPDKKYTEIEIFLCGKEFPLRIKNIS
jgi:hypothetical protein